jgi:hypothetical protein
MPHNPGTAAPPGTAGPAGAAAPAPCHVPSPKHFLPHMHNLYERDWSRKHWFDRMDEVVITWINGPPLRPINHHNCHSKTILSVTKRRRFIPRLRGGTTAPRGSAAPFNRHTGQNRRKEPTLNRLRSKDQERPSQKVVDKRVSCTPWSNRTYENGPTRSTDLTYL